LKRTHGFRALRGETFAIAAASMAEAKAVPQWTNRKRHLRATKALVTCGLIELTEGVRLRKWTDKSGKRRAVGVSPAQIASHSWRAKHERR
jgi:hypothetical protein